LNSADNNIQSEKREQIIHNVSKRGQSVRFLTRRETDFLVRRGNIPISTGIRGQLGRRIRSVEERASVKKGWRLSQLAKMFRIQSGKERDDLTAQGIGGRAEAFC
jgi:hypothetical protein